MNREGRWKPLSGGSPKISNLEKKKIQRDLLKFLHVGCRYLLQKLQGRSTTRHVSVCKGYLFQSTVGFIPLWFFFGFVRKHAKGEIVYKRVRVSEHHTSEKLWALLFPQTATRQLPNPFLQPALHNTLFFPLKKLKPGAFIGNILYICSNDLCIHTGIAGTCVISPALQSCRQWDHVTLSLHPDLHRALWHSAPEVMADLSLSSQLWPIYAAHLSGIFVLKGCCCCRVSWPLLLKTEGPCSES